MSKGKSIILLTLISVIMALLLVLTFVAFPVPWYKNGIYNYNSILSTVDFDCDLSDATAYTLTLKDDISAEDEDLEINNVLNVLSSRLDDLGYRNYSVKALRSADSDNYDVRIVVKTGESTDADLKAVAAYGELTFVDGDGNEIIGPDDNGVEKAYANSYPTQTEDGDSTTAYYCAIVFTAEGLESLETAIADKESITLTVKIGEEQIFSSSEFKMENVENNTVFISGISSLQSANQMAMQINTGGLEYEYEISAGSEISSLFGSQAYTVTMIVIVALIAVMLALVVLFFRGYGVCFGISMLAFLLLEIFFLIAVPGITVSFAGVLGCVFASLVAAQSMFAIWKRIIEEFNNNKTLKAAVKFGYRKGRAAVIDFSVVLAVLSVAFILLGKGVIVDFAVAFGIGTVLSLFVSLCFSNWLVKLVMPLVKNKKSFFKLSREDK